MGQEEGGFSLSLGASWKSDLRSEARKPLEFSSACGAGPGYEGKKLLEDTSTNGLLARPYPAIIICQSLGYFLYLSMKFN